MSLLRYPGMSGVLIFFYNTKISFAVFRVETPPPFLVFSFSQLAEPSSEYAGSKCPACFVK